MSETSILLLALIAGILLATIFFGGLWWTIRRGVSSKRPAAWFFGSLLLRTIIVLAGFYFASQGEWRRLLTCLLGFLLGRIFMMWLTRMPIEKRNRIIEGGGL